MQRRSMFTTNKEPVRDNTILATTKFELDKQAKRLKALAPNDKMKCAVRKILTDMSDRDEEGRRYFILSRRIEVLKEPSPGPARSGEPQTYSGKGRFKMGVSLPTGEMARRDVEFGVSFRDTVDDRGLPDVVYIEPSYIDDITGSSVKMPDLS